MVVVCASFPPKVVNCTATYRGFQTQKPRCWTLFAFSCMCRHQNWIQIRVPQFQVFHKNLSFFSNCYQFTRVTKKVLTSVKKKKKKFMHRIDTFAMRRGNKNVPKTQISWSSGALQDALIDCWETVLMAEHDEASVSGTLAMFQCRYPALLLANGVGLSWCPIHQGTTTWRWASSTPPSSSRTTSAASRNARSSSRRYRRDRSTPTPCR